MLSYNKNEMDNRAFSFIYGCALRDAILQKAFIGKKDWIAEVTEAQEPVKKYINDVLYGEFKKETDKEKHEKAFLEAAKSVCDIINRAKPKNAKDTFSFGNAQKLINIVTKHIYAHTYSFNLVSKTDIRANFRFCHCPMDSIMLSNVWRDYKAFGNNERANDLGENFLGPWGNEDFDLASGERRLPSRYVRYQTAVEKLKGPDVFPIEYDYIVWKS